MEYIKAGQDQTNRILEGAFEFAKQYGVETVCVEMAASGIYGIGTRS
jgi:hypothetical protein